MAEKLNQKLGKDQKYVDLNALTSTQRRRFYGSVVDGQDRREVAKREHVSVRSVSRSLREINRRVRGVKE